MFFSKSYQLNDLLERIGFKLQLNKTRNERAKSSYEALCKWIKEDKEYFQHYEIDFYAQGSYRTNTTVKPIAGEEFDLDFVMEMKSNWQSENPIDILNQLKRRLKESDIYIDKVEVKNRCIRVNYANEFHIDILPAIPESLYSRDTKIKVPDRDIKAWSDSNPKGYSEWFEYMCNKVDSISFEKRIAEASIEPLPSNPPYDLIKPLKRSVQLMKRFRDIYYLDKNKYSPRSIVLTTLAATHYKGDVNVYESILNILKGIKMDIINSYNNPFPIYNPMNTKENLSEKWDQKLYKDFCEFIDYFYNKWYKLEGLESLEEKAEVLKKLFGENISNEVLLEQANYIEELRNSDKLGVNTSTRNLVAVSSYNSSDDIKVSKNTFYGE